MYENPSPLTSTQADYKYEIYAHKTAFQNNWLITILDRIEIGLQNYDRTRRDVL